MNSFSFFSQNCWSNDPWDWIISEVYNPVACQFRDFPNNGLLALLQNGSMIQPLEAPMQKDITNETSELIRRTSSGLRKHANRRM